MSSILTQIVADQKQHLQQLKSKIALSDFEKEPLFHRECMSITEAIRTQSGIIAEVKRKSPSAGVISSDLNLPDIIQHYEQIGASAISCLTNQPYFGGSNEDLKTIRSLTDLPILRKEFIVDEFQIFESKAIGADAILLIAELLSEEEALHLTILAQSLGMEVVMEFHHAKELQKINELVNIIGVNNRNLHLQQTDINTSMNLYDFLPSDKVCISESGIRSMEDISRLKDKGFNGFLIGESLLKNELQLQSLVS